MSADTTRPSLAGNLAERSKREFSISDLTSEKQLPANIRNHLAKVYGTLGGTLCCTVAGSFTHAQFQLGGVVTFMLGLGAMVVLANDKCKEATLRRFGLLGLFGFLIGCSLGPLMQTAFDVDPSILVTSFLGTTVVFVCFSISAILATRRKFLHYGGLLTSMFAFTAVLGLINSAAVNDTITIMNLYMGLFIFCCYVLYDTQLIIEKVDAGSKDYIWHACELFVDFIGIFVRLVSILLKNSEKKDEKKGKDTAKAK